MEGDVGWCFGSGGGGGNNWDLHAVVRFACGGAARVAPPPPVDDSSWLPQPQLPGDAAAADDLCQAFFAGPVPPHPLSPQTSPPRNEAAPQQPPAAEESPAKPQTSGRSGGGRTARSKRKSKKSQVSKEVTRVPAGAPAPDPWAWRKYGQKPIKGSPYPRGYYRCSTDKDCKARKQVERCRTDPTTLIVTYTGEHSHPVPLHRNSLAGTTRNKTTLPPAPTSPADEPPPSTTTNTKPQSSASASAGLSPSPTTGRLRSTSDEYDAEEDDDAISVRLMLEDVVMPAPEDALLFLNADEHAQEPGHGGGFEDVMPFTKPDESAPATGNVGGWDDVMLFPKPDDHPVSPGSGNGGGYEDVMLFPKPDEPVSMNGGSRMEGGAAASPVMNIVEKFCVSGMPEWETAASRWGC
ncbi:hypothetical protein ACP70R_044357 [Stipagrostis hirtigluma subsp. patula]